MDKLEQLDRRITELKKEMERVEGTPTEVYARIVGYYRPVSNWNKGKREEFDLRKHFTSLEKKPGTPIRATKTGTDTIIAPEREWEGYLYFFRPACPNCPPVADVLAEIPFSGTKINVDTEDGFAVAEEYNVLAAPTVVFLDTAGKEVFRASTAEAVRSAARITDSAKVTV